MLKIGKELIICNTTTQKNATSFAGLIIHSNELAKDQR